MVSTDKPIEAAEANTQRASWNWPLFMAFIRLPLALAGSGIAVLAYQLSGNPVGIAAGLGWSTLTLTVVNLICIALLRWRARVEGFSLRAMIGIRRRRLAADLGWGLLWSLLLGAALLAGVFAVVFLWQGPAGAIDFERVFVGEADFSIDLPLWLAVVSAVAFPLLNPVVEELQYRGYAQTRLAAVSGRVGTGIWLSALGFGLQHVVFAVTLASAAAYAAGFFLWGLGAGVIAHRQERLFPLIVAHFVSNLSFGVIPLIIILTGGG